MPRTTCLALILAPLLLVACSGSEPGPRLVGHAVLPALTFADGPPSGQFLEPVNGVNVPFPSQPVLGFSSAIPVSPSEFLVLADNGYGSKKGSADFILAVYRVDVNFRTPAGGSGVVGWKLEFRLSDMDEKLGFPIVAEERWYRGPAGPEVPELIDRGRLLTGYDIDPESISRLPDGSFWVGDEFGPFLIHLGPGGRVLEAPIQIPGVHSPNNPLKAGIPFTLPSSSGFEGSTLSPDGEILYATLERPLNADPGGTVNLYAMDTGTGELLTPLPYRRYRLDPGATSVTDLAAISATRFLIMERDDEEGPDAWLKKIFLIDLDVVDAKGVLVKREVLDLLDIPDPDHLATPDGRFVMPYETIETVVLVDEQTIMVVNDNNLPTSVGRHWQTGEPDDTEFILVRFPEPLDDLRVR